MAYIYRADVWCDKCGERIREELTQAGKAPENIEDESSYDSDEFPKYYDADEESDGPENCASGTCNTTIADGHCKTYGTFLENQLTAHGYKYLKEMLDKHGSALPAYAQEWADYYSFRYCENEWGSAHEWLESKIQSIATGANGELLAMVRNFARLLDSDQIQDEYQSEMEDDGFFRESGWYSDESF